MKGENTKIITVFVVLVAITLLLSVVVPGAGLGGDEEENDTNDYITREPIRIDGNDDFAAQATAEGWPGDGSELDPYVIEGYEIDGTGYGYGIYIGNTTVHFVVRNSHIHNVSGIRNFPYFVNAGIQFYTVQKGNITSNVISDSEEGGINFRMAGNNIITDNCINNNYRGVSLVWSHNNVIKHNTIRSYTHSPQTGIGLGGSDDNVIIKNTISNHRYGIFEDTCDRNVIEDNIFIDNEIDYDSAYEVNGRIPDSDNYFKYLALIFVASISIAVAIIVISLIIRKHKDKQK